MKKTMISAFTPPRESLWPKSVALVFHMLAEMPWLALTTIATVGGTGLLVAYLRSVNYVGVDTTALVGLAIAAALAAVTFLSVMGSLLVVPGLIARV